MSKLTWWEDPLIIRKCHGHQSVLTVGIWNSQWCVFTLRMGQHSNLSLKFDLQTSNSATSQKFYELMFTIQWVLFSGCQQDCLCNLTMACTVRFRWHWDLQDWNAILFSLWMSAIYNHLISHQLKTGKIDIPKVGIWLFSSSTKRKYKWFMKFHKYRCLPSFLLIPSLFYFPPSVPSTYNRFHSTSKLD